jgi:hypothetical protein
MAGGGMAVAGDAASRHKAALRAHAGSSGHVAIEIVLLDGRSPVRIVRGATDRRSGAAWTDRTEIVRFGPGVGGRITIVRGGSSAPPPRPPHGDPTAGERDVETVRFADPRLPPVTIVRDRGAGLVRTYTDLFGPADGDEFDRIAFAVDGIESRHGADLGMWRAAPDGPQGPMQVSAAAAFDVGGGDRFDLRQNRLLGRAYLAQMFRRYGNWPDALAAYNWGPTNLDTWIAGGRDPARLPPGVAWYIARALRDAVISTAAGW